MKAYVKKLGAMSAVLFLCTFVGCYSTSTMPDVQGFYALRGKGNRIELQLSGDGTFAETITFRSGAVEKRSGKWHLDHGNRLLSVDDLWIPREFAPDYIVAADEDSGKHQPKYTEPGHWVLTPAYHWGTLVLELFPDDDVEFRRIGSTSAL